jgi:hypothetical protein
MAPISAIAFLAIDNRSGQEYMVPTAALERRLIWESRAFVRLHRLSHHKYQCQLHRLTGHPLYSIRNRDKSNGQPYPLEELKRWTLTL